MMDASILFNLLPPESSLPPLYWNQLSQNDKVEFLKLRTQLHQSQKATVKDRRLVSFSNEMSTILEFLEQSDEGRQQRSVLAGVAFAGPFICVNTRQLKSFLGRCKSSINGSFQQLGYVAVRTKSKAKACVLSVLPCLSTDPNLLRQWTVRGASDQAHFCFISKFPPNPMPVMTNDDLNEDRKVNSIITNLTETSYVPPTTLAAANQTTAQLIKQQSLQKQKPVNKPPATSNCQNFNFYQSLLNTQLIQKNVYDFDLSSLSDFQDKIPEMTPSYSVDYISNLMDHGDSWSSISIFGHNGDELEKNIDDDWEPSIQKSVTRSQSAFRDQNSSTTINSPFFLDF